MNTTGINDMGIYIEGFNLGYRLGKQGKQLRIPFGVFARGIMSKTYYDDFTKGLHDGFHEAVYEMQKQMIHERKLAYEKMQGIELDLYGPSMQL